MLESVTTGFHNISYATFYMRSSLSA